MSVLDYVDVGTYLYQIINETNEEKWIIKDINNKELLIENSKGKRYKMSDKELDILYHKKKIRIGKERA